MVQSLLKYPDSRIRLISANVRFFNEELLQWIDDMVDTMKANDLEALSAIMCKKRKHPTTHDVLIRPAKTVASDH